MGREQVEEKKRKQQEDRRRGEVQGQWRKEEWEGSGR